MFEEVLVEQNKHWQGIKYDAGVKRTIFDRVVAYMDNDFIISICGVRRAGKSTLSKQIINYLMEVKKINPGNILFLNLEDPVFNYYKNDVAYLEKVFQDFLKLQDPQGKVYLFLDEVQFFKDWEVFVKSKYEKKGIKIFLTGSNSRLLSADLATLLSGRTLVVNVFPFSFKEILRAKGIDSQNSVSILSQKNRIKSLFDEYIVYGGFPKVVFEKEREIKKDILKNYYQNIYYNDIVPRFEIKKSHLAEKLLYYLLSNVTSSFSYNNLSGVISLADKTIKEYAGYFTQGLLLFWVDRFSPSVGKQIRGFKKVYSIDNGLVNAIAFKISENLGPLFENTIAIDFLRREMKFFYYISANIKEVDFFIPDGQEKLVQVCYEMKNEKTRRREITALESVMKEIGIKKSILVTLDEEEEIQINDFQIEVIPAWKYFSK
ncbi:MAG: ATP-binding protein [Candidatus Aminicenantes bacterium]|nr:MAG: ATP-binding protein [Candidatus Aminicenantes bacterium]